MKSCQFHSISFDYNFVAYLYLTFFYLCFIFYIFITLFYFVTLHTFSAPRPHKYNTIINKCNQSISLSLQLCEYNRFVVRPRNKLVIFFNEALMKIKALYDIHIEMSISTNQYPLPVSHLTSRIFTSYKNGYIEMSKNP